MKICTKKKSFTPFSLRDIVRKKLTSDPSGFISFWFVVCVEYLCWSLLSSNKYTKI